MGAIIIMHIHSVLTSLLILLPTISLAWICFPPPHLLPTSEDCLALIFGLDYLSRVDTEAKRWGRHLPSTTQTEQLPKWFDVVDGQGRHSTCAIVVDVAPLDSAAVGHFRIKDVADAAKSVFVQCLIKRGQVGLGFPSEDTHMFAKVVRYDRVSSPVVPPPRAGRIDREGNVRMQALPHGKGFLYIGSGEPRERHNVSETS